MVELCCSATGQRNADGSPVANAQEGLLAFRYGTTNAIATESVSQLAIGAGAIALLVSFRMSPLTYEAIVPMYYRQGLVEVEKKMMR